MQPEQRKREIVAEAWRLLEPGGRYAIHELALVPDGLDPVIGQEVAQALSQTIHVGARRCHRRRGERLLIDQGFSITTTAAAPMALLEPRRLLRDEGRGVLRLAVNLLRDGDARR